MASSRLCCYTEYLHMKNRGLLWSMVLEGVRNPWSRLDLWVTDGNIYLLVETVDVPISQHISCRVFFFFFCICIKGLLFCLLIFRIVFSPFFYWYKMTFFILLIVFALRYFVFCLTLKTKQNWPLIFFLPFFVCVCVYMGVSLCLPLSLHLPILCSGDWTQGLVHAKHILYYWTVVSVSS